MTSILFTHLLLLLAFLSRWPLHGRSGPRHVQQSPKACGLPGWLSGLSGFSGLERAPARPHQWCPPSEWTNWAWLWRYNLFLFKLHPCCKHQASLLSLPVPLPQFTSSVIPTCHLTLHYHWCPPATGWVCQDTCHGLQECMLADVFPVSHTCH